MWVEERIEFCPHCGNCANQRVVHAQQFPMTLEQYRSKKLVKIYHDAVGAYYTAVCDVCQKILVYKDFQLNKGSLSFKTAELVWPDYLDIDILCMPESIANVYSEATKVLNASPDAFVILIRRGLEAICYDRGAKGNNLYLRLSDLAQKGEIPPRLADYANALRLLGNMAAHSPKQNLNLQDAFLVNDFFKMVVEYVYVALDKLKRFRERLQLIGYTAINSNLSRTLPLPTRVRVNHERRTSYHVYATQCSYP